MFMNDMKIWGGLFQGDFNQILSRFLWEGYQTSLGFSLSLLRNFIGDVDNVDYYDGRTLVNKNRPGSTEQWGLTLGSYINSKNIKVGDNMFMHEFGHTIQSQNYGPFFLPLIGIPSLVSATFSSENDHNHRWYEMDANWLGAKYFDAWESWDFEKYPMTKNNDVVIYRQSYSTSGNYRRAISDKETDKKSGMGSAFNKNQFLYLNFMSKNPLYLHEKQPVTEEEQERVKATEKMNKIKLTGIIR